MRSRGYIPHVDAPSLVQHVVFRLADSLPAALRQTTIKMPLKERVAEIDRVLDASHGGRLLETPLVAELVQKALLRFDAQRYTLIAWCIMPNHVHALIQTRCGHGLDQIVHSWKSYTGKSANRLLGRVGAFWAPEYFDRYMRDEEHLARTAAYIEGNPVKAGLCGNAADWRFSSASSGRDARGPDFCW